MTTSDIISMVCSGISLIATIIIAVLQIIQSNRMEKFEHKQDERDEKRHEEDIKAEAVTFISKYYHDRGLIPLCAMAAMHNDLYYYSREMYREFCCKTVEVQNRILKYLELKSVLMRFRNLLIFIFQMVNFLFMRMVNILSEV